MTEDNVSCRGETILSDYSYIPSVVFSSPHVAKVGLDEEDAVERYGNVNIFSSTFRCATSQMSCILLCVMKHQSWLWDEVDLGSVPYGFFFK